MSYTSICISIVFAVVDPQARYILDAVLFVADNGAAFLPQYRANYKTGEWKHKTRFTRFPERRWERGWKNENTVQYTKYSMYGIHYTEYSIWNTVCMEVSRFDE